MNRRFVLKALLVLPFVPLASRLAAATELALPAQGWRCSDIIVTAIEGRSRQIADNVYWNNSLLQHLRTHDLRMKNDPEFRRATYLKQWRGERWKYTGRGEQGRSVRVDARCPSGFAVWRETL